MNDLIKELDVLLEQANEKVQLIEQQAEEINARLDKVQEQYDNYREYVQQNYKEISPYQLFGINEGDFH